MSQLNHEQLESLEQLGPSRRSFFQKLMAGSAVAAALPVMSSFALADDDDDDKGRGKGKGKGDGKGKGKGKGKGDHPDPARLAARLIAAHDKDGDKALNLDELTAALKALHERRMEGKGKGKGKGGEGKGKGKGKGKGER